MDVSELRICGHLHFVSCKVTYLISNRPHFQAVTHASLAARALTSDDLLYQLVHRRRYRSRGPDKSDDDRCTAERTLVVVDCSDLFLDAQFPRVINKQGWDNEQHKCAANASTEAD